MNDGILSAWCEGFLATCRSIVGQFKCGMLQAGSNTRKSRSCKTQIEVRCFHQVELYFIYCGIYFRTEAAYAAENSIVQHTPTQLKLANRIIELLSPVKEITQSISKGTAALSVVILNIRVLLQSWEKHHHDQGICTMKEEMIKSLKSRFAGIEENRLLSIVTHGSRTSFLLAQSSK